MRNWRRLLALVVLLTIIAFAVAFVGPSASLEVDGGILHVG